jgi:hypothetical protein
MEGGYSWIGWYLNPPSDCSPPLVENAGPLPKVGLGACVEETISVRRILVGELQEV